jgi:hypothetical protein
VENGKLGKNGKVMYRNAVITVVEHDLDKCRHHLMPCTFLAYSEWQLKRQNAGGLTKYTLASKIYITVFTLSIRKNLIPSGTHMPDMKHHQTQISDESIQGAASNIINK